MSDSPSRSTPALRPPAPESGFARLLRDPYVAVFTLGFLTVAGVRWVSREALPYDLFAFLSVAPFLLLTACAIADAARRTTRRRERRFWWMWIGALGAWCLVSFMGWVLPMPLEESLPASVGADLLYVVFYTLVALSAEVIPHRAEEPVTRAARRARSAGVLVFVFGMFVYFVLIPSLLGRVWYETWIPSLLLYFALDLYLVLRFLRIGHLCRDAGWQETYTWCAAVASMWAFSDGWNVLTPFGLAPETPAFVWELLGFPALAVLLVGVRRHALRGPTPERREREEGEAPPARWGGVLMAYAVIVPAMHFFLHSTGALPEDLRGVREVWVLAILSQLALLSFAYQRRVESEVRRLGEERRLLNRRIELTERMEAVGRLAGGVAHDFNNSLQLIGTHADILLRSSSPEYPEHAHASAIRRAVTRAGSLTDQLLTLGRKRRIQPVVFDLNRICRSLSTLAREVVGERVELSVRAAPEPLWVEADLEQLEHATLNLLLNARDALPDGGRIELSAHGDPSSPRTPCVLVVSDDGVGMDEEVRSRIFEPFFTTKGERGTGLGLSMVYGIVTQCGGLVRVESEPGAGSRFELALPAAPSPPAPDGPVPDLARARSAAPGTAGASILVVEDDLPILSVIKMHLRASGHDVRTAPDGRSALEQFGARPADLVITDVAMPGMTGPELRELIAERRPGTPVVFMSGYAESVFADGEGDESEIALLRKPFTTDDLDRAVRQALSGRLATQEN